MEDLSQDFLVAEEVPLTDFALAPDGPLRGLASTSEIAARLSPKAAAVIAMDRTGMCLSSAWD
jgi:hypothetical protein